MLRTLTALLKPLTLLALAAGVVACSEPEPPPPPPPPPPPAPEPEPEPEPVEIDFLAQSLGTDARVQFPQALAPVDEALATATLKLADALAKGDEIAMSGVLAPGARAVLDDLVGTGAWYEATADIEAVRVVRLSEASRAGAVTLAVQVPGSAYALNWFAVATSTGYAFEGLPSPAAERARASAWDGSEPITADAAGSFNFGAPASAAEVETAFGSTTAQLNFPVDSPVLTFLTVELNKAIQQEVGVAVVDDSVMFAAIAANTGQNAGDITIRYEEGQAAIAGGAETARQDRDRVRDFFVSVSEAQNLGLDERRIEQLLDQVIQAAQNPDARSTPRGNVPIPRRGGA